MLGRQNLRDLRIITIQSTGGSTWKNRSGNLSRAGTVIAIEGVHESEANMKAPVFTTVGELIAILFDETRQLGLRTRERPLLVAYLLNHLLKRSSVGRAALRA